MGQSSRTFRIFVSSTFSDLKAERNALQEKVFPRLRDLVAAHGCRFQAIDLRWGVSEEAALGQQTMKICLGEIERCQKTSPRPNFIILLGDRYGWRPVPYEIPADEFELILPLVSKEDKFLLEQWYRWDGNALPPLYCLQPRSGEFVEYEAWEKVGNNLRQVLLSAIAKLSLSPDSMLKYTASATEQEIEVGALKVPDAREHVFCFLRDIQGMPEDGSGEGFWETDPQVAQKQTDLKERLKKRLSINVHEYKAEWQGDGPSLEHLDQLCEDVYAELSKVILAETGRLKTIDPLDAEIIAHETFGAERARVFVGRAELLVAIEKYISGNDPHPLAIWGASGSGKSALMAKAIEQAQKNGMEVIYRFIGATPESSNGRALLESLCKQISRNYGADESIVPSEYRDLVQEFPKRLALAKADKPLLIFLDALDQLSDSENARSLAWMPADLPTNVRLIMSTLPGECLQALQSKLPDGNQLEVQPMPVEEGRHILNEWLSGINRRLEKQQEEHLLGKFQQCGLPLYLKLAYEEAKLWKSYDPLPELSGDIPGILRNLFKRLSKESNHGKMLVSRSLGYLAAAKNGLSEDELLDVLSLDKEMLADFHRRSPKSPKVGRLPVVVWSRLYFDLEPYLTERIADGASLLAFYHTTAFKAAVTEDYLSEKDKSTRHQVLATYFNQQSLYFEITGTKTPNLRKINEQPWHLASARDWQKLYDLLAYLPFLEALWKIHPFETKAYWTQVEANSEKRMVDAYHLLVTEPSQANDNYVWIIAHLFRDTGHYNETSLLWENISKQYRQTGDRLNLVTVLSNQGNLLFLQGKLDAALIIQKEAENIYRDFGDMDGLQRTLSNEASILKDKEELDQAMDLYRQAEKICRELKNSASLCYKLNNMAGIFLEQGKFTEAQTLFDESEQLSKELDLRDSLANALGGKALILYSQNKPDRALDLHRKQAEISRQIGDQHELQHSLGYQARIMVDLGKEAAALLLLREQESICEKFEDKRNLMSARGNRAMVMHRFHHSTEALSILREVEQYFRETGVWIEVQGVLRNQARVLSDNNDVNGALAQLEKARSISENKNQNNLLREILEFQTKILIQHGKLREAYEILDHQASLSFRSGNGAGLASILAAQGQLLVAQGQLKPALAKFREQEKIYRELGNQKGLAEALNNLAGTLRDLGDFKKAELVVKEQVDICQSTGNYLYLQAAFGTRASILTAQKKYNDAMALLKQQENISRAHNIQIGIMMSLGDQANIRSGTKDLNGSLELERLVEQLSRKTENHEQLATSLTNQALALIQLHKSYEALQAIEEAETLARTHGFIALGQQIQVAKNWMRAHR